LKARCENLRRTCGELWRVAEMRLAPSIYIYLSIYIKKKKKKRERARVCLFTRTARLH